MNSFPTKKSRKFLKLIIKLTNNGEDAVLKSELPIKDLKDEAHLSELVRLDFIYIDYASYITVNDSGLTFLDAYREKQKSIYLQKVWLPIFVSVVASLITSLITIFITNWLGLL